MTRVRFPSFREGAKLASLGPHYINRFTAKMPCLANIIYVINIPELARLHCSHVESLTVLNELEFKPRI